MPRKEDNVSATLRAIGVLESLVAAERPATLAELTAVLRLPKPTLYRMLAMLERAKLVAREPGARRYTPGPRLAALGRNVMLNGSLRTARHAILSRLVAEIGETCNFTMLDGAQVVYLDRVETPSPLRMNLQTGSRVPLHCTASGKLLLAMLPKAKRDRLTASLPLPRHTAKTIVDGPRFERELQQIRAQRYSTDDEEYFAGLVCVAVPVRDGAGRTCAALAVHAPMSRMPLARQLEYLPALKRAAEQISRTFTD